MFGKNATPIRADSRRWTVDIKTPLPDLQQRFTQPNRSAGCRILSHHHDCSGTPVTILGHYCVRLMSNQLDG